MKKFIYPFVALAIILLSAFTTLKSTDWNISDNYSVKFDGGDPSGEFTGLKGTIQFDEKKLATSKFDVTIDVASINTGNGMKNTHAKGAGWFDAEKFFTEGCAFVFIAGAILRVRFHLNTKKSLTQN